MDQESWRQALRLARRQPRDAHGGPGGRSAPSQGKSGGEQWPTTPKARVGPTSPTPDCPSSATPGSLSTRATGEHARRHTASHAACSLATTRPRTAPATPHGGAAVLVDRAGRAESSCGSLGRGGGRAMSERPGRPTPSPDRPPSILVPRHWIDRVTTVRVDRRVHGTDSEISGTAAYKYGMDVLFTVRCELCRSDVDARGEAGGSGNCQRRTHYRPEDPGAWWRRALEIVELHRRTPRHVAALTAAAGSSSPVRAVRSSASVPDATVGGGARHWLRRGWRWLTTRSM